MSKRTFKDSKESTCATAKAYWRPVLTARLDGVLGAPQVSTSDTGMKCFVWDEELKGLQTVLAEAQRRRNDLFTPTSKLPSETLAYIFNLVVSDEFNHPTLTDRALSLYAMRLSCVCVRWRKIALGYKRLWSYIYLNLPSDIKDIFIARAGPSPLHISGSFTGDWLVEEKFKVVARYVEPGRFRALSSLAFEGSRATFETLNGLLGQQFQQLHTLRLSYPLNYTIISREGISYLNILDFPDVCEHLYKASHIKLEGIWFPWLQTFTNIRSLVLYSQLAHNFSYRGYESNETPNPASMFAEMLNGLRGMPNLRVLVLFEVLPSDLHIEESEVRLPLLQKLFLRGPVDPTLMLLKCLQFPSTASVTLDLPFVSNEGYDRQLHENLATKFTRSDMSIYCHLSINHAWSFNYQLTAHAIHNHSNTFDPKNSIDIPGYYIRMPRYIDTSNSVCRSHVFVRNSPVHNLVSLSLVGFFVWTTAETVTLLGNANLLKHLEFSVHSPSSIYHLCLALSTPRAHNSVENDHAKSIRDIRSPTFILPNLKSLRFSDIDFKAAGIDERLYVSLEMRHTANFGINELDLDRSIITPHYIPKLERFVQNVFGYDSSVDLESWSDSDIDIERCARDPVPRATSDVEFFTGSDVDEENE